jgi:hypothetical protein
LHAIAHNNDQNLAGQVSPTSLNLKIKEWLDQNRNKRTPNPLQSVLPKKALKWTNNWTFAFFRGDFRFDFSGDFRIELVLG